MKDELAKQFPKLTLHACELPTGEWIIASPNRPLTNPRPRRWFQRTKRCRSSLREGRIDLLLSGMSDTRPEAATGASRRYRLILYPPRLWIGQVLLSLCPLNAIGQGKAGQPQVN